jgi:feruloyl esterase
MGESGRTLSLAAFQKNNPPLRNAIVVFLALCTLSPVLHAQPARNIDQACSAISELSLPQTHITRAEAIQVNSAHTVAGTQNGLGLTAPVEVHRSFCRVVGVVDPAINFEVWMPLENWNGRFRGVGLGAFYGKLPYAVMANALDDGYAVGGTDTGHRSEAFDGTWAMRNGELNLGVVEDWTHRGIHEMTVKSQAIVAEVYGRPAQYSYFTGCSSGGFQAMTEAQRYPDDYDGILAGAPANFITHLQAAQISFGLATQVDPATSLLTPINKLPALHEAVLATCDALDGAQDGLIENPAVCPFEPEQLACKGADSESCLTAPQVQAVRRIYADILRSDGTKIFPGFPKGSESSWHLMAGGYLDSGGQVEFAESMYRYFVFQDPDWDYATMDLERDVAYADRHVGEILNSNDPDLRPFRDRGGKLIQYHGWADWGITPYNSIDYFNAVTETVGGSLSEEARGEVQEFHRLFLMPGVSHCRGGAGPDTFDGLGALEAWVERGEAPEQITAAKVTDGEVVRTRPLCPYPEVARYNGSGSIDEADNFTCVSADESQ